MRPIAGAILLTLAASGGWARAQSPRDVYTWAGVPSPTHGWQVWGSHNLLPASFNRGTISAASGNLVVQETGTGALVGGSLWIIDPFEWGAEGAPAKGHLDVTGLDFIEIDLRHNHPTATVPVDFLIQALSVENLTIYGGSDGTTVVQDFLQPPPPSWQVGPGLQTLRFPVDKLSARQQTSIKTLWLWPQPHAAAGNLTWTISAVRTTGTPLAYRDIVTNDAGSLDDGLDGAFPLHPEEMRAIVGNLGDVNQLGLTRNASGSGSLQWTDKGGSGASGDESGAMIGWGNGAGWRNAQPGDPTAGNGYNQRIADFSNYDRMTVRVSARDVVNPAGSVGIAAPFFVTEFDPPTVVPSQDLPTDGQYHELTYDLTSVPFLRNVWHWGLDVAPHPNDIVFNVDNIRVWNSAAAPSVPGDFNGDGSVNAGDLALWNQQFAGPAPAVNPADADGDGRVDGIDLLIWQRQFGAAATQPAAAAVPEPSAGLLAATAAAALGGARRLRRGSRKTS